jgi:hypothetical protein
VVPRIENSALLLAMSSSWPSQKAQPRGAKLPAKRVIWPMYGSDMDGLRF